MSPTSTAQSLTHTLATALARHADHSFGLMGNGNAHLIDALGKIGIPYTAVRHEAGTVAAADAYTRVCGKIAIATSTYGAGFSNLITALTEAALARTPMLVVVGDAPSDGRRPWDIDQELIGAAIGVRTYSLSVANIDRTIDRAVAYAMRARRPVVIAIPYDLVTATAVPPTAPIVTITATGAAVGSGINPEDPDVLAALMDSSAGYRSDPQPSVPRTPTAPRTGIAAHQLEAAVRELIDAERPLIIAGHGAHVSEASGDLGALADALGALTSTTALGRGIFPRHEYDLGITGGFGQEDAMAVVATADVVVVVGASLNQFTMRFGELFGPGTIVIRIDDEQVDAPKTNHPISHLLLQGDARTTLATLTEALADAGHVPSVWREQIAGLQPGGALRARDSGLAEHPDGVCGDGRLDPRAVATRIGELLPQDRHVTTDGGHFIGWANMYWPVTSPERLIMVGTAYQSIGLGFHTIAGLAAAAPESTAVLSTGDGGGLMALSDLETAIRTSRSSVIVVWNDGAYGAEVHLYGVMGLNEAPMLIPDANFAGVAEALGAQGVRVSTLADLDALATWVADGARGTILLDCRVSRSVVADYQREIQRANGIDLGTPEDPGVRSLESA